MISLSTLFSFETASTTSRISLFISGSATSTAFANAAHKTNYSGANRALPISASFMLTEKLSTSISMLSPSVRRSMPVYRLRPSRATLQLDLHAFVHELREVRRACATRGPVPATKPRANTHPGTDRWHRAIPTRRGSRRRSHRHRFLRDGRCRCAAFHRPAPGTNSTSTSSYPISFKTGSNRAMRRSCSAVSIRPSNKKGPQRPSRTPDTVSKWRRSKKTKAPSGPSTSLGSLAGQAALPHRGRGLYGTKSVVDRPWLMQVPCAPKVAV